jgi:(p)ppGpp synthase/HD superfamily hydrolase
MNQMKLLAKSTTLATTAHNNQFRKQSGLPYIVHPLEGVLLLQRDGMTDENTLCAMMLHDSCESDAGSKLNFESIQRNTNKEIADCVRVLTCTDDMNKEDYIRSFITAPVNALVVKLYDRYMNVNDFERDREMNNSYYCKYANKGLPVIESAVARIQEVEDRYGAHFAHQMRYRAAALRDIAGLYMGG